ncbi:hypothetical protein ACT7DF_03410 [Bacillus cereus]
MDCDRDGNVKFIEMNYKGKAVGNETSVANEKLEPFDAEAGSEVGKNIANIKFMIRRIYLLNKPD